MSDRMTSASAPSGAGIVDRGRKTRAEMIQQFRRYYQHQLDEAQAALAVPDEQIVVETYVGVWAQRNREVVR